MPQQVLAFTRRQEGVSRLLSVPPSSMRITSHVMSIQLFQFRLVKLNTMLPSGLTSLM
jgi:hypothetical protein